MKKYLNKIIDINVFLIKAFEKVSCWQQPAFIRLESFLRSSAYARLMRLDKLSTRLLLILPAWWAILFNVPNFLGGAWLCFLFFCGATVASAAGCIINDLADQKFDKLVKRTMQRPLASGEIKRRDAYLLLMALLFIAFLILLQLPKLAITIGLFSIIPIIIYPFMKRVTHFAQFFLGLTYNVGVLIAWITTTGYISIHAVLLYLASAAWTTGYDTIYAHQDREDDIALGLKSTAIKFADNAAKFVWSSYQFAAVAICIVGLALHMNILFYMLMGIATYHLYWQTETLEIDNRKNCELKFKSNVEFGFIVLFAILLGRI